MTLRLVLPLAASLALAVPAVAQEGAGFDRIDSDGNGQISRAEIDALRAVVFDKMDANGNGSLTRAEVEDAQAAAEGRMKQGARRLWRNDSNGDGELTRVEFLSQSRGFDMLDGNGDGTISRDEFDKAAGLLRRLMK